MIKEKIQNILTIFMIPVLMLSTIVFLLSKLLGDTHNIDGVIKLPKNYTSSSKNINKLESSFNNIDESNEDNLFFKNKYLDSEYFIETFASEYINTPGLIYDEDMEMEISLSYKEVSEKELLFKVGINEDQNDEKIIAKYYFTIRNNFIL